MKHLLCLLVLVGCGKQLNAEYCAQKANADDPECIAAGFTRTDAPVACQDNAFCSDMQGTTVCDTAKGECVQCTPMDPGPCASTGKTKCGPDDQCHECLVDTDCVGGAVCLPDLTCASADMFLYTTPGGTGNCSQSNPCTLKTAIGMLTNVRRVIAVGTGDYKEGPLTIGKDAVLIGQGTMGDPTATTITNGGGQQGPVITVSAGMVALDYVQVHDSPLDDGVTCTGGALTFHHSNSVSNGNYGISASNGCVLEVDRAMLVKNTEAALYASNAKIAVYNNFIYQNGTSGNQNGGAVRIANGTSGDLQYNSISYNIYKASSNNSDGGLTCRDSQVDIEFNIVTGNQGKQQYTVQNCTLFQFNYVKTVDAIHYAHMTDPYDLHLTAATPTQLQDPNTPIVDNSNTTCVTKGINLDIDGQPRPAGTFCDLGADEYQ